jgi:hypothetical protein
MVPVRFHYSLQSLLRVFLDRSTRVHFLCYLVFFMIRVRGRRQDAWARRRRGQSAGVGWFHTVNTAPGAPGRPGAGAASGHAGSARLLRFLALTRLRAPLPLLLPVSLLRSPCCFLLQKLVRALIVCHRLVLQRSPWVLNARKIDDVSCFMYLLLRFHTHPSSIRFFACAAMERGQDEESRRRSLAPEGWILFCSMRCCLYRAAAVRVVADGQSLHFPPANAAAHFPHSPPQPSYPSSHVCSISYVLEMISFPLIRRPSQNSTH